MVPLANFKNKFQVISRKLKFTAVTLVKYNRFSDKITSRGTKPALTLTAVHHGGIDYKTVAEFPPSLGGAK